MRSAFEMLRDLLEHEDDAAAGRGLTAVRALQRDWLAGDERGRVTVQLPVLVHEPGHRLRVGADVRRRDVARRPDYLLDLVHERARHRLQLVALTSAGVDVDATLGAAVGDAHDRGFPGH